MTTQDKTKVMQAFLDGKKIQRKLKGDPDSEYVNLGEQPEWNWEAYSFRVRPEPMEIQVWVGGTFPSYADKLFDKSYVSINGKKMEDMGYTLKTFVEKV